MKLGPSQNNNQTVKIEGSNPTTISTNNGTPSSKVFSTSITFKECVNILHYCRLIYKYIIAVKESSDGEENQVKTFTAWLLLLMEEIRAKINNQGIIYEGENAWLREKKLREVTNEYSKKYKH